MAGEGSIQGMITSLRNNKKLLRRPNLFRQGNSFLNLKKEYLKAAGGKVNVRKLSKEELAVIRKKVVKERRKENRTNVGIFIASVLIMGYIVFYTINEINEYENGFKKIELKKSTDEYLSLIADGDQWLKKRSWRNAIFEYKKALEIFPSEFDINFRLASAYAYRCESEFENCNEAKELLNKLLRKDPRNLELLKLKKVLEFEYQSK